MKTTLLASEPPVSLPRASEQNEEYWFLPSTTEAFLIGEAVYLLSDN